jgi:hypothetical protein
MMSLRKLGAVLAAPLVLSVSTPALGQDEVASDEAAVPEDWEVPHTPWGDPDLRGNWPIDYLAQTPRQRPAHFGTRDTLTDQEYENAMRNAQAQLDQYGREDEANKLGMGHWIERGRPLRQASLITEPADGRIPAMTPKGEEEAAKTKSSWSETSWEWIDDFSPFDRCITRGMPGSMLPGNYNGGIEVYQSPGYVAIRLEMVHETRIVPVGDVDAPPEAVKSWLGFSRGHWEGDTLVIETTNFVPGVPISNVGNAPKPVPNSEQMKITERLTPTGPDNIRYEAWIEDPVMLTAPFKYDFPWQRNPDYVIYEYACHEGNIQLPGFITSTSPHLEEEREAVWEEINAREGNE